jgi:phosphate acetyltransferase
LPPNDKSMHWIVEKLREQAKKDPRRIALPEPKDERVKEAIKIIEKEKVAWPVVVSADTMDKSQKEAFAKDHYGRRQDKYDDLDQVRSLMQDPLYYAAMMTRAGQVDGFVAGAIYSTSAVARAAIRCLTIDSRFGIASGCFIMAVPDSIYGERGVMVFSDCAVVPEPRPQQLASIGLSAAEFTRNILNIEPKVAFLSFSTKGSGKGRLVEKIREAMAIVKDTDPRLLVDGELQADAALDQEIARRKLQSSPVAGRANVLIFPDLESGNISYKLAQRLAKARALGPILLGFKESCSDLSRGCSVDDIVDCAAILSIRAGHLKR